MTRKTRMLKCEKINSFTTSESDFYSKLCPYGIYDVLLRHEWKEYYIIYSDNEKDSVLDADRHPYLRLNDDFGTR